MSKRFNDGVLIVVGLALIAVTALWRFQEPPDQAYERGYAEGEVHVYTLWKKYLQDTVDTLRVGGYLPFDSTDTLPAVDSVDTMPPEPLYEKIVYDEYGSFSVYPPDTTYGDYLVNSYNVDRIDTVNAIPDTIHGSDWYAQDDSTLCRQIDIHLTGFVWCSLIQVHLKQGRRSDGRSSIRPKVSTVCSLRY